MTTHDRAAKPRPRTVTLLALWVLCLAVFNAVGLVSGVRRYTVLSHLPLNLSPVVLIVSSAIWLAVFMLLAFGLWRLKQWARWGTPAAMTLYLAQFWIERLGFGQTDYISMTVWFYVSLDVVILLFVWGGLLRSKVRQAFSE